MCRVHASETLLTLSSVYCMEESCSWNEDWKMRQKRRSTKHGTASRSRTNLRTVDSYSYEYTKCRSSYALSVYGSHSALDQHSVRNSERIKCANVRLGLVEWQARVVLHMALDQLHLLCLRPLHTRTYECIQLHTSVRTANKRLLYTRILYNLCTGTVRSVHSVRLTH